MKQQTRELTDVEVRGLVKLIAAPTFKYMMRRINNNILLNEYQADMSINSFISVVIITIASLDANILKWIEKFYKLKIGQDIDFDKLKFTLTKNLNEQLGVTLN